MTENGFFMTEKVFSFRFEIRREMYKELPLSVLCIITANSGEGTSPFNEKKQKSTTDANA